MRISDWSSDVCSSDLRIGIDPADGPAAADVVVALADRVKTLAEMAKLLGEVVAEQVRPGDRGGPVPRRRHMAIGEPRIDMGKGGGGDRHLRVEGAQPARPRAARQQRLEAVAQEAGGPAVERTQPAAGGLRVASGRASGGERGGR